MASLGPASPGASADQPSNSNSNSTNSSAAASPRAAADRSAPPSPSVSLLRIVPESKAEDGSPGLGGGGLRHVSEFDLVRYDKNAATDDFEAALSRTIMKRCFDALDVEGAGRISPGRLVDLANYLRLPVGADALAAADAPPEQDIVAAFPLGCTFDEFYAWWRGLDELAGKQKLALVSAEFAEPFHVQQLLRVESGEKYTLNYRVHFRLRDMENGKEVPASPWHDIPVCVPAYGGVS
jgi:hypothetical protein